MDKFNNTNSVTEVLNIYLYDLLVNRHGTSQMFSFEDYSSFQLTDTLISSFNNWIDENDSNENNIISQFITANVEIIDQFIKEFGTLYKPKVVIWSDRKKTPYFEEKLQMAFEFEQHIYNLFLEKGINLGEYTTPDGQYSGENEFGVEIKNDTLIKKTGNIYIEYMEKSKASNWVYVNSGILKNDNTKYILIGDYDAFWIFRKERLVQIYNEETAINQKGQISPRGIQFKQIATSRGFTFPVKEAEKEAISIDTVINELSQN